MALEQTSVNRRRDELVQGILALLTEAPQTRSDIFYKMRFSWPQVRAYESWLAENGLIEIAGTTWTITTKGRKYLSALQEAETVLKGGCA